MAAIHAMNSNSNSPTDPLRHNIKTNGMAHSNNKLSMSYSPLALVNSNNINNNNHISNSSAANSSPGLFKLKWIRNNCQNVIWRQNYLKWLFHAKYIKVCALQYRLSNEWDWWKCSPVQNDAVLPGKIPKFHKRQNVYSKSRKWFR